MISRGDLIKISDTLWEIPKNFRSDMLVPARLYASEDMLEDILKDHSLEQLVNVATLPGIYKYALLMPDAHEGYGFPIGGVAAFSAKNGIISPGGIGYDINCGVRLLKSKKIFSEVKPYLLKLGQTLYKAVPSGVGRGGRLNLKGKDLDAVLRGGASDIVRIGYGKEEDLEKIESGGILPKADSSLVSETAKSRGKDQLGTMGAGNHFVEVGVVEEIFNLKKAEEFGIFKDQVVVLIHTGSRGLGHQIATDYIRIMMKVMPKYGITLPDNELACAPFSSPEGKNYFSAISAGANFAWANRQLITWEVREVWKNVLGDANGELEILYDVAHNLAKLENDLVVHRKGATRAFPGQPVLIPGSMGTVSYLCVGGEKSLRESFGSSAHGAGRIMSRSEAKRKISGSELKNELEKKGIVVSCRSFSGLVEEAPAAYKDVHAVVNVIHKSNIAEKVASFRPAAVVKG